MSNRRVLVLRDMSVGELHDVVRSGDTIVDEEGNPLFVLGVTPRLNFPEYDNTSPQDGDLWKWNDKLWVHLSGVTYRLLTNP